MRLVVALLLSIAIAGCSTEYVTDSTNAPVVNAAVQTDVDAEASEVAFNLAGAPTCEISVPGMMCEEGCGATVQKVLAQQPGVKDVKIDFESKTAIVAVEEGAFDADAAVHLLEDEYGFADTALKSAEAEATAETLDETAG
jgi:copper chaperone CopZ